MKGGFLPGTRGVSDLLSWGPWLLAHMCTYTLTWALGCPDGTSGGAPL